MSEPASTTDVTDPQPPRKRSKVERLFVWGGIVLLLLTVTLEWRSREGYNRTLAELDELFGRAQTVTLDDLSKHIHGFALRSELQEKNRRVVVLRWPSLFREYALRMPVDPTNHLTTFMLDEFDAKLPADLRSPKPAKAVKGLPAGYDNVFALNTGNRDTSAGVRGILPWEIIRQGLLIAAEEELGLTPLDSVLGQQIPAGEQSLGPYTVNVIAVARNTRGAVYTFSFDISQPTQYGAQIQWMSQPLSILNETWLESLVEQVEAMSRGPMVEALQGAGYQKVPSNNAAASITAAEDKMDFVSQFARLHFLRSQIRTKGETPETLGALVRAYANLGSVTDFHWSRSSKIFKARALLYAQRLVAKTGATPFSLAHRAYALALTGRHLVALDAVAAAKAAQGTAAPEWLNLIEAYCGYVPATLDQTQGEDRELALYLRMRMTDLSNEEARVVEVTEQLLNLNPICFRAAETLSEAPGLGLNRNVTESRIPEMWSEVYEQIAVISGLPADAKEIATAAAMISNPNREAAKRMELIDRLEQADVPKGPSPGWSVLAGLLREVSFVQTWRELRIARNKLGMDPEPIRRRLQPLFKGHRLEPYLQSITNDRQQELKILAKLLTEVEWDKLDIAAWPLALAFTGSFRDARATQAATQLLGLMDPIYEDVSRTKFGWERSGELNTLIYISPHWPQSVADRIVMDWEGSQPRLVEWEAKFSESPTVLDALSRQYQKVDKLMDAIRCLEKSIKASPTCASYVALAHIYKGQGERDKWLECLEKALDHPTFGLEESRIHSEIAGDLMRRGEWKKAWPHAESAASSYSADGLLTAVRAAEGLGNWKESEAYVRACAQRYEGSAAAWYLWCLRTGRGSKAQSRALAERRWKSMNTPTGADLWQLGTAQLDDGKLAEARATFEKTGRDHKNIAATTFAAIIADLEDNAAARDELFKVIEINWDMGNGYTEFSNLARGVLSGKEEGRWSPRSFEQVVLSDAEAQAPYLYYLAGTFLNHHGQPEIAQEYLKLAASAFDHASLGCVLASAALRKQKIDIPPSRLNSYPDDVVPLMRLIKQSEQLQERGKEDEALSALNELLQQRPDFLPGVIARGDLYFGREEHAKAIADYEEAIRLEPNDGVAHLKIAWLYATGETAEVRDGKKALSHAERAAALQQFPTWASLSILAAAQAECGDFEKAVELEIQARNSPLYVAMDRFKLYSEKKPYHQESKKAAAAK